MVVVALAGWVPFASGQDLDAGVERTMLWHCHDGSLESTGFPGCDVTLNALKVEIGSASLEVVFVPAEEAAPLDPRALAQQGGAIFVAWVVPGLGPVSYVLYAYDSINMQIMSKEVVEGQGGETPNAEGIAFLYRNMLGTSLFADLESIETDVGLWSLAFPDEKVKKFRDVEGLGAPVAAAGPTVLHLDASYMVNGFFSVGGVWHEVALGLHGRVHRLLEVWLSASGAPGPMKVSDPSGLDLDVWLVQLSTGLRIVAFERGILALMPGLGAGLDVVVTDVSGGLTAAGSGRDTGLNATGFASILLRLMFHRRFGLGLELGAQVLFNTRDFCVIGPDGECEATILDLGRVSLLARLGVVFGL